MRAVILSIVALALIAAGVWGANYISMQEQLRLAENVSAEEYQFCIDSRPYTIPATACDCVRRTYYERMRPKAMHYYLPFSFAEADMPIEFDLENGEVRSPLC